MSARRSGWKSCARYWAPAREPSFKHATPEYVRFEKPPVVERLEPVVLAQRREADAAAQVLRLRRHQRAAGTEFAADWEGLVQLAARWVPNPELERQAQQIIRARLEKIAPAIVRPYSEWLSEDYYIFLLSDVPGNPQGLDLLSQHGPEIAQVLRGEQLRWLAATTTTCCSPASCTIPTIWSRWDGMPRWCTTRRRARRPRSRFWSTPTRSCWSFVTMTSG